MTKTSNQQLADALDQAVKSSPKGVVRSADLSRKDRELLQRAGYLKDIVKGWYFLVRPGLPAGESTAWYASYWNFLETYLSERFGNDYCLSAVTSLELHTGTTTVPRQVVAMTAHGGKTLLALPHETSVLVYQDEKWLPKDVDIVDGLRVMKLPNALCRLSPVYFRSNPVNVEIALRTVQDVGALIKIIIEARSAALAGRFAGAYAFLGEDGKAHEIEATCQAAGISVVRENPFDRGLAALMPGVRVISPYAGRIQAMFRVMREPVLETFKDVRPAANQKAEDCISQIDDVYVNDAYNSLSIEGYRVSSDLVRRIRDGNWNPEGDPRDRQQRDAMAAKGYLEAFTLVKESVQTVLSGTEAAEVAGSQYQGWYRALFSATVSAGLLEASRMAGHRDGPVYIRNSKHVPPRSVAVSDCMEALFECLRVEPSPVVRAVLGHMFFGFIHPYFDGNGRLARFLMNLFLATGGYPWTIVRTERRDVYLNALESASTQGDITPFARFIREEMDVDWSKQPSRRRGIG
jgi:hypothetical protein